MRPAIPLCGGEESGMVKIPQNELIRLSVGSENVDDLIENLEHAFNRL
jgi:cystathionine beta-lyase/cystathionine gamma-synthase